MSNKIIATLSQPNTLKANLQNNNEIKVNIIGSGARGEDGEKGLSAYEVWIEEGNEGAESDFFNSIHPTNHSVDIIVETDEKQFISFEEKLRLSGFTHNQIASSNVWIINHTLNKFPSVSIVDSGGNLVMGDVEYLSKGQLSVSFNYDFSGKAYLN